MVRSLALAVALALGTVTVPVHALGLGDIQSRSALNQQFDADVALLSVNAGELEAVRARLATAEAFERAGIERPFFLTLLKFRPERLANGEAVIRVTSDFPIREPFLNFLLEVNWPRGKLVREYTVLLDPPTLTQRRAPQVRPAPARLQTSQPAAVAEAPATVDAPATSGSTDYGPVKANETLWGIAAKLRPRGATMQQMMIALLQANPQAFIDGNVNQLRKGQILRVPAAEEILGIDRGEALNAVRDQQAAWRAERTPADSGDADETAAVEPGGTDSARPAEPVEDPQLRIATARPEGEGEAGASEDRGDETLDDVKRQLILARENAESTRQESEVLRGEIGDLQKRLDDMKRLIALKDEQLARLQGNVAGRTAVGDVGAEPEASSADEAAAPAETDPVAQAMQDAEQATEAASGAQEAVVSEGPVAPPIDTSEGVEYPIMKAYSLGKQQAPAAAAPSAEEPSDALALPAEASKVETASTKTDTPPVQPSAMQPPMQATEKPSQVDKAASQAPALKPPSTVEEPDSVRVPETVPVGRGNFVTDYLPWLIAGGGVLIILLLLLLSRRGKGPAEETTEDGVVPAEPEQAPLPEVPPEEATEVAQPEPSEPDADDTSFLSEFTPSDINALRDDTGEVDPVSEADVYIAYGRYQQAEELLRQAMEREENRLELKHKLLEVYYATQNRDAYVTLAQDMLNAGQDIGDPDAWARAKEMGRELDAANPLFQAEGAATGKAAADATSVFEEFVDTATEPEPVTTVEEDSLSLDDLDLSSLADELGADEQEDSELLASELDSGDTELTSALDEVEKSLEEDSLLDTSLESLELDLPDLDSEDLASALNLDESLGDSPSSGESAKDIDALRVEDAELSVEELQAQLEELSDLSMLDTDLSQLKADLDSTEAAEPEPGPGGDALDQPLSLDEAFELDDLDDAQEIEEFAEVGGPVDEDAAGTKLDLARAYIEMGDLDGARGILDEVKQEGNAEQQQEAEKLLGDMS